ncbi:tetratricopeptide repeat protein [Ginsengibacter hankyongi]|uniref:Tetratricopeptide repeat protein n=1 Tax=Ginsengibacter hankyongi TaxID=2607284 RepID=A0A5J5IEG4_9BACT|nr:tetratricopeptide repeat protein [Ginsengibacter hankyongi]KAA9037673.1 tetratricopeptide repeat protein [Ginsengibacter hankyongi]
MMKTILKIACGTILTIIISCNNNSNDKVQADLSGSSKESLKNAIKKYPDSLLLIQDLIEAYRNEGSYDSALTLTDDQIKKDSNNAYLWNMKATLHFENDDTLNAINSLEHAVDIYPMPEYLVALGTIYAEVKNPKSLIIADGLLKVNRVKSGADAMFVKGLYYSYNNDKTKAINYFDSSLHMDFTYMFSYREKAIALYDLEKYEEALEVLKRAVTVQNNFDEGYYWMGRCYEKLGKKDDAIQSYQTALLYDKNFIEAREALNKLQGKTNN